MTSRNHGQFFTPPSSIVTLFSRKALVKILENTQMAVTSLVDIPLGVRNQVSGHHGTQNPNKIDDVKTYICAIVIDPIKQNELKSLSKKFEYLGKSACHLIRPLIIE